MFVGGIFAVVGLVGISTALVVLGLLSRRLGQVTRAPRYYLGFFVAALLIGLSILFRLVYLFQSIVPTADDSLAVLFYVGLPALALTFSLIIAWRYWSWLLAERS